MESPLEDLCRLCGINAKLQNGSPTHKSQLSKVIERALGIGFNEDDPSVHPSLVCVCCSLKLSRWKQRVRKYKKTTAVNIQLKDWTEASTSTTHTSTAETVALNICHAIKMECEKRGLHTHMWGSATIIVQLSKPGRHILKRLEVNTTGEWNLEIQGKSVLQENLSDFVVPLALTNEEDAVSLLNFFEKVEICPGNNDIFNHLRIESRNIAQCLMETTYDADGYSTVTLRHRACKVIARGGKRCDVCRIARTDLFAMRSKTLNEGNQAHSSSHSRDDLLSETGKLSKLKDLRKEVSRLQAANKRLESQMERLFVEESSPVSDNDNAMLKEIFDSGKDRIETLLVEGTPQYILWKQQVQNLSMSKNRWRWHPDILRWCVALFSKSSSAYSLLRESGFLTLPSTQTINKYIHFAKARVGIVPEILNMIVQEIDAPPGNIRENVTLILDEMKINSGLVFSCSSGKLIGFCDVGDVNNLLNDFEQRVSGQNSPTDVPLASHVLVVMVRTIFAGVKSPLAYYATHELKGEEIYPIVWECIQALEVANLHVRAVICDGASQNRKFFNLHKSEESKETYFTMNPYRSGQKIYFFCDAPHLLKTLRNNWENSGFNRKTRMLRFRGRDIKWSHLLSLQEWDQQQNTFSPGLRFVHKLSHEHLHLNPSLRMRVYLAAEVLSNTVANALESMKKDELSSTIHFVRMINKWFDCMNVANTISHRRKRNPAIAPFCSLDDDRFEWLETEFLGFLDEWHTEAMEATDVPASQRPRLFLSKETYTGLKITVKSFIHLARELLATPGVEYVLSEKFSQDPLEEYFSKQRGCGGRNENPSVEQFGHNVLSLMVAGSKAITSVRGNCRKRSKEDMTV